MSLKQRTWPTPFLTLALESAVSAAAAPPVPDTVFTHRYDGMGSATWHGARWVNDRRAVAHNDARAFVEEIAFGDGLQPVLGTLR